MKIEELKNNGKAICVSDSANGAIIEGYPEAFSFLEAEGVAVKITRHDMLEDDFLKLQNQLKEAEELLVTYNHHLKNDNGIAKKIGTTIDDYFTKYMNKSGENEN